MQLKELQTAKAEYQEALKNLDNEFSDMIVLVKDVLQECGYSKLTFGDEDLPITFFKDGDPEFKGIITKKRLDAITKDLASFLKTQKEYFLREYEYNLGTNEGESEIC